MKFTCPKNEITKAIQINTKAISNKPQMPILSGIYIHAENNILSIETTDYDIGIICKITANVQEEGAEGPRGAQEEPASAVRCATAGFRFRDRLAPVAVFFCVRSLHPHTAAQPGESSRRATWN